MIVNGFRIEPARGGYGLYRRSAPDYPFTICRTLPQAVELAKRFIPEDENGKPLERYKAAPWWRRLFNPGAVGTWVRT